MLRSELLEIIANGENSGVEFKRDDLRPEQLAKEIVALLNLQGGKLLLGVEDDGTISGIQRADLETWVMDTVFSRYVHPLALPFYEEIAFEEGKRVAVISLTQGTAKPYVVRNNSREEIYVRVGSTSRLATREQQARLFESGGMLHSEVLPVSGSTLDDLDRARLTDYLVNIAGDQMAPQSPEDWEQRLTGLGFLVGRPEGRPVCTIAGLVLFGRSPRRCLRYAGVRWMSFAGDSKEYLAQDDAVLDGPLVALWEGRLGAGRSIIEDGLLERLTDRMRPFISEESGEITEGLRREASYRFPSDALREALLNALVHRDWTRSIEVEVINYIDRLEVTSPGALQNSMTIEKMLAGQRSPRNPIIVEIMRDYGYVDARGMGVRRKIVPLTRNYTGRDANFELTDDYLRVILPARRVQTVIGPRPTQPYDVLDSNPPINSEAEITAENVAQYLNTSLRVNRLMVCADKYLIVHAQENESCDVLVSLCKAVGLETMGDLEELIPDEKSADLIFSRVYAHRASDRWTANAAFLFQLLLINKFKPNRDVLLGHEISPTITDAIMAALY